MCYGQPDELLKLTIGKRELPKNDLGHSPLDDFEHFCAYTGCSEQDLGQRAFAFVRLAYITASLNPLEFRYPPLGEELEKACADIAMLLRDRPPGTTADITEDSVLYWDDGRLNGAHVSADEPEVVVVDPFKPEEELPGIREAVAAWLKRPAFTFRPSLLEWLEELHSQKSSV